MKMREEGRGMDESSSAFWNTSQFSTRWPEEIAMPSY